MRYQDEGPGEDGGRMVLLHVDRREFVKLVGSGLTVFFSVDPAATLAEEPARPPGRQGYPSDPNAYLRIGEDGRVACFVGKVELGQGVMTSLAQLVAEDLDVPLERVDMVMGDTEICPWDMGTFGSLSIRAFGPVLRGAAAEARELLVRMASERLGTPIEQLAVEGGVIADRSDGTRRVTYAELTRGRRIERRLESRPALKGPAAFKTIGRSAPRRDAIEKVTGRSRYAADIVLDGMLHARILRAPAHGATLREVDASAAEKVEGVRVVRDGDLVAVLHEVPDHATRALGLLEARFDRPAATNPAATVDDGSVFEHLVKAAPAGEVVHESGSLREGEKLAATLFDETYLNGYVAHAAMETHAAVARLEQDKVTVWASTQAPFIVRTQVASALGLAPEKVRVITPFVGGGFGGKTGGRQAVEAARLARIVGRPVQVMWDRPEEFFLDTFRPAAVVRIRSGLTAAGRMAFWDFVVHGAGDREARQFYDVAHQRTVSHGGWHGDQTAFQPLAVGPWRAPSVNTNTFARESQIDIMASRAGIDPLEFRMRHLSDPRMRRVLAAAAERFGWSPGRAPSGRGVGVACAIYLGTYGAWIAKAAVDGGSGRVRVERIVCAQEMGVVVNPEGARQQMEGSLTMGLGYALAEEVRFSGGAIADRNFDTYEIPRFSWVPAIDTILLDAPDLPASGGGEPPIVGMGAVVANAIHDAVGVRLRRLPMTPARIKEALARKA